MEAYHILISEMDGFGDAVVGYQGVSQPSSAKPHIKKTQDFQSRDGSRREKKAKGWMPPGRHYYISYEYHSSIIWDHSTSIQIFFSPGLSCSIGCRLPSPLNRYYVRCDPCSFGSELFPSSLSSAEKSFRKLDLCSKT